MTRTPHLLRLCAALTGAATAAALMIATPVSAAPAGDAAASSPVVAQHTITLVTGDVVHLATHANGNQAATVQPAADRLGVSYATRTVDGQTYVIPTDVMPLLAADRIDEQLFNVSALVADGFHDAASKTLPLIISYQSGKATAAAAAIPTGVTAGYTLESINARSVHADKARVREFWTELVGTPERAGTASEHGILGKVWLNRKVTVALTESVPQVGAPQAWAAGFDGSGTTIAILDTGIDDTHADLDGGKVTAEANFSTDTDTIDHHGHGTHVASTAAGTGEASPANRRGVAPGASLINAKVLNSAGSGAFDGIIEGLEYAAAQGADVASMSLGTNSPSNGNDPLVQAVDRISQETGMLIVVAAGNLGSGESTIASPGWANEALTVGAVSKQDALASFSSRGPRLGDFGIKPDITGPGVDIVAARAAGTQRGPIVDEHYTRLSGTSMATPHVSGAAAILAQAYPDHTNEQIKNTLISTARTITGQSVYQQGGGRLDLARAVGQRVYADPGTLNLGFFAFPQDDAAPVTKTVSYANDTNAAVTLNLSLQVSGRSTGPAPAGMFTLSQPAVTVPAGGTAAVEVTIDPAAGPLDLYGGYLTATSGDVVVHTSVGAYLEPEMHDVTVTAIARDGRPAAVTSWAELWSLETGAFLRGNFSRASNTVTLRVPPGTYNLSGYLGTADEPNVYTEEVSLVNRPQLEVTGDTNVVLDATSANEVTFDTREPTAPSRFTVSYFRGANGRTLHSSLHTGWPTDRAFATPTEPVTEGQFEFYTKWRMVAPPVQAEITRPQRIPLDPQYMTNAVRIDGRHTLPLEYVGFGRPEDYVGHDVRGKIALISRSTGITFADMVRHATDAGAWGALVFNNAPGLLLASAGAAGQVRIPAWTIRQEPGQQLVDLLLQGQVVAEFSGTAQSPYLYDLIQPHAVVPTNLHQVITRDNTAQVNASYVGDAPGNAGNEAHHFYRPWATSSVGVADPLPRPLDRTEYVSSGDTRWWHLAWMNAPFDAEHRANPDTYYQPRTVQSQTWFGGVRRPGVLWAPSTRTANQFALTVFPHNDSGGHGGNSTAGDTMSTKLFAGDQLLRETTSYPYGSFPALQGTATYRLEFNHSRNRPWWNYATSTATTWTFQSSTPATGTQERPPLMQLNYDLGLDNLNRAASDRDYNFTLGVGHQPGVTNPGIGQVQVWASFDDGANWQPVQVSIAGPGRFRVNVHHPQFDDTTGAVSLRVSATDRLGNSIDQTVIRAYGLRAAG